MYGTHIYTAHIPPPSSTPHFPFIFPNHFLQQHTISIPCHPCTRESPNIFSMSLPSIFHHIFQLFWPHCRFFNQPTTCPQAPKSSASHVSTSTPTAGWTSSFTNWLDSFHQATVWSFGHGALINRSRTNVEGQAANSRIGGSGGATTETGLSQ